MKHIKLLTTVAIAAVVLLAACQKDTFVETVGVCPTVLSTNPENRATDVPINQIISVHFNELMNPATITQTSFTVEGAAVLAGTVSYNDSIAYFIPASPLLPNTTYTGRIKTTVKDLNGNALQTEYVWTFVTRTSFGPGAIDLNSVARFGIIAGTGVSSIGLSEIHNLDVGNSPGARAAVTGFPPAIIINGNIYASDDVIALGIPTMLIQAKSDLNDAYILAKAANVPAPALVAGDLGGMTLKPGIYRSNSALLVQSGDLTLDAQGDANAVWIFQIDSDLTTVGGAGGNILLTGGAQAKNIFWQVGSSATIGSFTSFYGNILALTSITLNTGATATGRLLVLNGAVTLTSTNIIQKP